MAHLWQITQVYRGYEGISGITVNESNGQLYFTCGNGTIWKLNVAGKHTKKFSEIPASILSAMVFDHIHKTLYVCCNQRILKYDIAGRDYSQVCHVDARGLFLVGQNDELYFTHENSVGKVHLKTGLVGKVAGSNLRGYEDGTTASAKFDSPCGITIDEGVIYVCDKNNDCIRKIQDGMVTTIASKLKLNDSIPNDPSFILPQGILIEDRTLLVCTFKGIWRLKNGKLIIQSSELCCQCIVPYRNTIYVGTSSCRIFKMVSVPWKTERWLWIGNLKNSSKDCLLATLPKELLREIIRHVK